ncbi:serine protease gd isoform X1 [Anastrepha obliqua]|uniref:serine protease gd isoform X1 n=1 Tax=Anastrepha obliqua TaxID=95512 RepID=UPI002409AD47|nr:serine protease gd isoform X1 [Anastrepha obliqua]
MRLNKFEMHFPIVTLIIIIFQHINRILTHGIHLSPCPKIFEYNYDGTEWFGLLTVRNPDPNEDLHIKVTLSMRGKPTNYLGEIELLSRGQLHTGVPVLYKIKFPRAHFPPKLLQVSANNQVICVGQTDHSMFVTQIQLEHTRKFTFIGGDEPSGTMPEDALFAAAEMTDEEEDDDVDSMTIDTELSAKRIPMNHAEIKAKYKANENICGKIDPLIRSRAPSPPLTASTLAAGNTKPLISHTDEKQRHHIANSKIPLATSVRGGKVNDNGTNNPLQTSDVTPPILLPNMADNAENVTHFRYSNSSSTTLPATILQRGAWPWLAAIYVNNLTSLTYQCAGTLVSSRVVISSAHCFQLHKQGYPANEVLVFLGRHNLQNWNEEYSIAAPVSDIFIYPDYDDLLGTYDADIAVVMLKHQVRFNTYIRPACLWSGASQLEYIVGERGFIVGWGISNTKNHSKPTIAGVPRIIEAPIVSNEVCFASSPLLRSLTSNRTFCAGSVTSACPARDYLTITFADQRVRGGPCTGDSGAGLFLKRNNRWLLRGMVSATLPSNQNKCLCDQYVIYVDVAKFLDWIMAFII